MSSLATSYGVVVNEPICNTAHLAYSFDGVCEDGRCQSLHTLCADYLGCELDKTPSTANWEQRPMPAHMIQCAAI